jgi:secretion system chaperone SscA
MLGQEELQQVARYFEAGGTLKQLRKASQKQLDDIYDHARLCYQRGQFATARNFFILLASFNQWRFEYQLGLGLCYQELGEHPEATECFSYAAAANMEDPRPPYFCGISYQAMRNFAKAEMALQAALKWALNRPENRELVIDAKRRLAQLTLRR